MSVVVVKKLATISYNVIQWIEYTTRV